MAQGAQDRGGTANRPGPDGARVQELLDAFARGLAAGDAPAIARLWNLPSYVLADETARTIEMREEVEELFSTRKEQYAEKGVTDTRAEITRLEWLTDRLATVDVRWPWLDADGRERGEERSTYTVRCDDAGNAKICVAILRGASEAP